MAPKLNAEAAAINWHSKMKDVLLMLTMCGVVRSANRAGLPYCGMVDEARGRQEDDFAQHCVSN